MLNNAQQGHPEERGGVKQVLPKTPSLSSNEGTMKLQNFLSRSNPANLLTKRSLEITMCAEDT